MRLNARSPCNADRTARRLVESGSDHQSQRSLSRRLRFGAEPLSDQRPVAADVMKAVSLANADFGTDYQVSEIQIDERDTYRPQIYQMLAYQLVQYAVGQGLVFDD